jgi:hypothetical protein
MVFIDHGTKKPPALSVLIVPRHLSVRLRSDQKNNNNNKAPTSFSLLIALEVE